MLNTILAIISWYFLEAGLCIMILFEAFQTYDYMSSKNVSVKEALRARFKLKTFLEIALVMAVWPYILYAFVSDFIYLARIERNKREWKKKDQQNTTK